MDKRFLPPSSFLPPSGLPPVDSSFFLRTLFQHFWEARFNILNTIPTLCTALVSNTLLAECLMMHIIIIISIKCRETMACKK